MSMPAFVQVSASAGHSVWLDLEVAELMDDLGVRVMVRRYPRDGVVVQAVHRESRSTLMLAKLVTGAGDNHWAHQIERGADFTRANLRTGGGDPRWRNEGWRSKFPVDVRGRFAELAQKGAFDPRAPQMSSG